MDNKIFRHDVFLSYASEDIAFCEKLTQHLRECGVTVWFDQRAIEAGDVVPKRIRLALSSSRRVIAIWSPDYFRSDKLWTKLEWILRYCDDPHGEQRSLIPILLKECVAPEMFPNHCYIDFRNEKEFDLRFRQLVESLGVPVHEFVKSERNHGKGFNGIVRTRSRDAVTFEIADPSVILLLSEVLPMFTLYDHKRQLFAGTAVVTGIESREKGSICSAELREPETVAHLHVTGEGIRADGDPPSPVEAFLNQAGLSAGSFDVGDHFTLSVQSSEHVRVFEKEVVFEVLHQADWIHIGRKLTIRIGLSERILYTGEAVVKQVLKTDSGKTEAVRAKSEGRALSILAIGTDTPCRLPPLSANDYDSIAS